MEAIDSKIHLLVRRVQGDLSILIPSNEARAWSLIQYSDQMVIHMFCSMKDSYDHTRRALSYLRATVHIDGSLISTLPPQFYALRLILPMARLIPTVFMNLLV